MDFNDDTKILDFNNRIGRQFDDFKTFLNMHYVSKRRDSKFWEYVADEALLSGDIRISLDTIDIADILMASPQKIPQSALPQLDKDTASDAESTLDVGDVGDADTSGEDE